MLRDTGRRPVGERRVFLCLGIAEEVEALVDRLGQGRERLHVRGADALRLRIADAVLAVLAVVVGVLWITVADGGVVVRERLDVPAAVAAVVLVVARRGEAGSVDVHAVVGDADECVHRVQVLPRVQRADPGVPGNHERVAVFREVDPELSALEWAEVRLLLVARGRADRRAGRAGQLRGKRCHDAKLQRVRHRLVDRLGELVGLARAAGRRREDGGTADLSVPGDVLGRRGREG